MSRIIASSVLFIILAACGGSNVAVGKTDTSDQKLQTTKTGGATGDGATCSWANTSVYDSIGAAANAPIPTYSLGDEFKSIDGCNECSCAAKGIMCTVKTCTQEPPQACDSDAKLCSDGSTVGRAGPNCAFPACPGEVACTADAKRCADGSYVSRAGANCTFPACGNGGSVCPALAKQCPDGSYASASGPNCDFVCPAASCEQIAAGSFKDADMTLLASTACNIDADCTTVNAATECSVRCTNPINKNGVEAYNAAIARGNSGSCTEYKAQSCPTPIAPPCAPSTTPKCVNKVCQ